jgi:hypothetical protein
MPNTTDTPNAANAAPAEALAFWAENVAETVLTAEGLDGWLQGSARGIPKGGTPAGRVEALVKLWRELDISTDSPDGPADRARAFVQRVAGRTTALEARLAELLHNVERELAAALKAGGNCASDPVILTADFGGAVIPVRLRDEVSDRWLVLGRLDKLPEGHHVHQALPLAEAYQWAGDFGQARPWVLLGSPVHTAKGRGAADFYFMAEALRLTVSCEQRRRRREEERAESEAAKREWRERERAEHPAEKERRLNAEMAALRAEVDRLKAAAERAVPS